MDFLVVGGGVAGLRAAVGLAEAGSVLVVRNKGQMVGAYGTGGFVQGYDAFHGFLDDNGAFTSFDVPLSAAPVTSALGINDQGEIEGFYTDVTSTYHGFVASFK